MEGSNSLDRDVGNSIGNKVLSMKKVTSKKKYFPCKKCEKDCSEHSNKMQNNILYIL